MLFIYIYISNKQCDLFGFIASDRRSHNNPYGSVTCENFTQKQKGVDTMCPAVNYSQRREQNV